MNNYSSAAWASDMPLEWFYFHNISGSAAADPYEIVAKMPYSVARDCWRLSYKLMALCYMQHGECPMHTWWQHAVTAADRRIKTLEEQDFTGPECL